MLEPPRSVRPHGIPPGVVATELLLARSEAAAIYIEHLDAFTDGFELEIRATAASAGTRLGADVFGRHWPMVGEKSDELPAHLLRIGVQFADGRTATNVTGHDRPPAGPIMWPLAGGGGGGRFHQGYWVAPLPPPGPVALACEWPAGDIPLTIHELDAQLILDGAERARAAFPDDESTRIKDGRVWRIGTAAEVAWINEGTTPGPDITAAIPPIFASYCTLQVPTGGQGELTPHEHAVIALLTEHTPPQPWWLGYLDTGARGIDIVFPDAPMTTVYTGWRYVLVEAGPEQAASWRASGWNWALPDLMFPEDHSWLVSTMWDDEWTSIGGPDDLMSSVLRHTELGPRAKRMPA